MFYVVPSWMGAPGAHTVVPSITPCPGRPSFPVSFSAPLSLFPGTLSVLTTCLHVLVSGTAFLRTGMDQVGTWLEHPEGHPPEAVGGIHLRVGDKPLTQAGWDTLSPTWLLF